MAEILLVGPYPPPYGGIATHVASLAPALAQRGHGVTILALTDNVDEVLSPAPRIEVRRVNAVRRLKTVRGLASLLTVRQRLRPADVQWAAREAVSTRLVSEIVEEKGIDLTAAYMITTALFVPSARGRFGDRVRLVTTVFGELVERGDIIARNRRFYQQILEESDQVMATSRYCAGLVRTLDYEAAKVEVVYVGVDVARFSPNGAEVPSQVLPGRRRILFLGRFHEEMGLDVILEAIPDVVRRRPEAGFLLIGARGPLSDAAARARAAFPENVFVHQEAPFSALPGYYLQSELLVAPTRDRHACMGVSIKEAMVAGKAIVATNSGGIPEAIVHGDSGIVLDLNDNGRLAPPELADAVTTLLDDPEEMRRLGQRARERALRMFDSKICLDKNVEIFERLLQ